MRKKKELIVVAVFAMLFALAQVAFAAIPNRFISTDGDSNFVDINLISEGSGLKSGWSFGVYDNDWSSGLDLVNQNHETAKFSVTPDGDGWQITVDQGVTKDQTLDIGNSKDFSFYFKNAPNHDTEFSISDLGSNQYLFNSKAGGKVMGNDLAAVSLPSSAIFLFSGILGLVAFGSRRETMK